MNVRTPEDSLRLWDSLAEYCRSHWDKPDLFPLRIALAQYAIHWQLDVPPVWSFILGPSGSAKSSMVLQALRGLEMVYPIDIIGKNTFMSGLGKEYGILPQLPQVQDGSGRQTGVLIFSDFSTFLEMDPKERRLVQSILRVAYDGDTVKAMGNAKMEDMPDWKGKVTVIAACTNDIEHYWSLANALGERFVSCNMVDRSEREIDNILDQALAQLNNGSYAGKQTYGFLVQKFVDRANLYKTHLGESHGLKEVAKLAAAARRSIKRSHNKIMGPADPEYPTRLIKELGAIAMGNAALMRRLVTEEIDINFAKIVGISTIPKNRLVLLYNLWLWRRAGYVSVPVGSLQQGHRGIGMFDLALEDLEALNFLTNHDGIVSFTPWGYDMLARAEFDRWIVHPTDF